MPTIVHSPANIELEPAPIPADWILEGQPVTRGGAIAQSQDGTSITGIWDRTRSRFHWYYTNDETVYILEGGVTITTDDGNTLQAKAGDVLFFPCGSHALWFVENYVRKVAILRNIKPVASNLFLRFFWRLRFALLRRTGYYKALATRLSGPGTPSFA